MILQPFQLKTKIKKNIYPIRNESANQLSNSNDQRPSDERSEILDVLETIKLFEDGKQINSYSDRDTFLKDYELLQKKIETLQKNYHNVHQQEVERVIKEFDFKNYAKRYKTNCAAVLAALLGVKNANRELLRYGMSGR